VKITFPRVRFPRIAWPRIARRVKHRTPIAPGPVTGVLGGLRTAALALIAGIVVAASAAAFAESYHSLLLWARHHSYTGFWAAVFPLQVDSFIIVGELALVVAMTDAWVRRDRIAAWAVAFAGLAASIAGNVGHIGAADIQSRGTAAVPPLAAFAALWVGLGVLKRVVQYRVSLAASDAVWSAVPGSAQSAAEASLRATLAAGNPWSGRQLETRFGLSRAEAAKVRELVLAESNGHAPEDPE
jgi:hypothetical protein